MQTKYLVAALAGLFVLLVGFAWWVWFATEQSFGILIPLLFTLLPPMVVLTIFAVSRMQAGKGAQGLEKAIRESPRADSGEIKQMQREFEAAVDALKRSKLAKSGDSRDALYRLPWYVVIGPPACGKTTLLRNSGLQFPEIPGTGRRVKVKGIGGTRNCDWFLTNRAVLLDTAGRWTMEEEDHDEWLAFLDLLKRHRGAHPLNGLIAAINIDAIGSADDSEIEDMANRMRERLDEVMARLGLSLPIYMMFTKCDLIQGFVDTFGTLSRSERERVWGFTRPLSQPLDIPAEYFEHRFDELCDTLELFGLQRLPEETDGSTLRLIYEFPSQLRSIKEKLSAFTATLFEDNVYQETPVLRGVYFTSGTQEGAPADLLASKLASALKVRHLLPEAPQADEAKAYFLKQMLSDVVFEDDDIATTSQVEIVRRHRRRLVWTSVTFALSALLTIPASFAYAWNSSALSDTRERIERWYQESELPADGASAAEALRPLYEDLEQYEDGRPSFWAGFGIYRGDDVVGPLREHFGQVIKAWVVRPLLAVDSLQMREVKQQLLSIREAKPGEAVKVPDEQHEGLLEMVKLQLLLADSRGPRVPAVASKQGWIVDQLLKRWGLADREGDQGLQKKALRRYVELLSKNEALAIDIDDDTVNFARTALSGDSPAERALNGLVARFRSEDLDLAKLTGPTVALSAEGTIPGAFTHAAWAHVYRMIEGGTAFESVGEHWVLGGVEAAGGSDDRVQSERGRALRAAYLERYQREWKALLSSLNVRQPTVRGEIEAVVGEMARPDGPLNRLLANVSKHTKLEDFGTHIELEKKEGQEGAPPPAAPRSADLRKLEEAFQGFTAFSEQLGQYQSQLRESLTAYSLGQSDPSQKVQLGEKLRAASASVEILLTGLPGDWSDVWSRVLRPPFVAFSGEVSKGERHALDELWCNGVVRPFMDKVGNAYPLNPAAKKSASLSALSSVLAPSEGELWRFHAEQLDGKVVSRQGDRFRLEPGGSGIAYNVRVPDFLSRAWALRDALFPDGGPSPKVSFDVRIRGASDLRKTVLSVGGKAVEYTNGPLLWQRLEWPGQDPMAGATLSIVRNDNRPNPPLKMSGEWGLFKLLKKGAIAERGAGGRSFSVVWQPAVGERIWMDFRAVGDSDLLQRLPPRAALRPPGSLTAGGVACRAAQ
ncbi:MAG: type VI secretion system membrane subunit TssM [Myxococcales bacterium]|nr:type VI secretion system membrane subunit TssM [Myxococcales bacterium]